MYTKESVTVLHFLHDGYLLLCRLSANLSGQCKESQVRASTGAIFFGWKWDSALKWHCAGTEELHGQGGVKKRLHLCMYSSQLEYKLLEQMRPQSLILFSITLLLNF